MPLNNCWVKEEIKDTGDKWKWKCNIPKCMGCSKDRFRRALHKDKWPPNKKVTDNLTLHLKELEDEDQAKNKVGRRKQQR